MGVVFLPRKFQLFRCPTLILNRNKIRFVDSVKCLGVYLSSTLNDDIARQVRNMCCSANMLEYQFYGYYRIVKNNLSRPYCTSFYSSQLWCTHSKNVIYWLHVAYNDSYRILHNLPRWTSAC